MTTYVIEITKIANNFQRNGQRERRLGGREGVGRILRRGLAEGVGGGGKERIVQGTSFHFRVPISTQVHATLRTIRHTPLRLRTRVSNRAVSIFCT